MNARKIIVLLLVIICFLSVAANANEFQRILFMAAGNLGVTKGTIELSGWNDAVAAAVRAPIAATIDLLRELLDSYPDPPFDANTIRNIISRLERFDQLMARRNVQAREAYFAAIHGNLQAAMSVIFRSQTGLEYEATCDTFVVNAGFHMGRAQVAADQGNRNALTSAIGSVNLAIRGGIQASEYLGCGFPTFAQWQTLRLNQARTRADMNRAIADASGLIANANGISSPANVIPSSGNIASSAGSLIGAWRDHFRQTFEFRQEGNTFKGYLTQVNANVAQNLGYTNGELIFELTQNSPTEFSGRERIHYVERDGTRRQKWGNVTIVVDSGGNRLTVMRTNPDGRTSRRFLHK